jgi:hypothetical protein
MFINAVLLLIAALHPRRPASTSAQPAICRHRIEVDGPGLSCRSTRGNAARPQRQRSFG